MMSHILAWFFPVGAVRQEITVEGGLLAVMAGYHVKNSIRLNLLPAYIPDCRSYTVEYRLSGNGEFEVSTDDGGNVALRSDRNPGRRFPVCWLPRSFEGKRVDRYILMVDRKRVFYRAGVGYRRAA